MKDNNKRWCAGLPLCAIYSPKNCPEKVMNTYVLLGGAIVAEVIGTTLMKYAEGFTRLWPSVATIMCYCTAFYLLSRTLDEIPTGVAYAIWSGTGIVLISLAGWMISGQKLDTPAITGIGLICTGVLVINFSSKTSLH